MLPHLVVWVKIFQKLIFWATSWMNLIYQETEITYNSTTIEVLSY